MRKARRACADCAKIVGIKVVFARRALEKTDKIRTSDRRIDELRANPTPPSARQMQGEEFVYRIPFHGDYGRIIYRIISESRIKILLIGTREDVYRQWTRLRLTADMRE